MRDRVKREDILLKIGQEAARLEPSFRRAPVRADDLLRRDGEAFVDTLYRRILKRKPDAQGMAHYSDLATKLPKPLIVYFFSRSEEARRRDAKITGLCSASIALYLKTRLSLIKDLFSAVAELFSWVQSLLSFHRGEGESKADYSRFYVDFEERFRGSEQEVEQGLRLYLSLFQGVGVGDLVVDLGSGRGEWLSLLRKEGFDAQGVEVNPYFIEECEKEGLDIVRSDVFRFLKKVTSSTVRIVTAFHLIEHLGPQRRLPFLREIYRVLEPGGIMILETPNPRNILVSAGDFWRDPEHIAPVFPDTLSLMAESVGFREDECYFFNKSRTAFICCSDVGFRDLQDYVEVSRDFALFARKS